MRRLIQNILLLAAFVMLPGNYIYAEANNEISKTKESFSFESVSEKDSAPQQQVEEQAGANTLQLALISNNHKYVLITAALFAFTLIIISFLMTRTPHQASDLVTIIGLVSVIFGSILLVLVVDTTETLTAPMGILGAIAGYLFGAAKKKEVSDE